jgi:hypothetical protein
MNDELKNIWKTAVIASSRDYPGICLEGPWNTRENKNSRVSAEIPNGHLPNIHLERCQALPLHQPFQQLNDYPYVP